MRVRHQTVDDITCVPLSLRQVRSLRPIPSGFTTDRVYCLFPTLDAEGYSWRLEERPHLPPLRKRYDDGHPNEWLRSYPDAGPTKDLHFIGAVRGHEAIGLATWRIVSWNRMLWLVDIRVREEARRTGAGRTLVRCLQSEANMRNLRGVRVETQINNYPAVRFYHACGFTLSGFDDHLYSNDDLRRQDVCLYLFWEAEVR